MDSLREREQVVSHIQCRVSLGLGIALVTAIVLIRRYRYHRKDL
ncbi:MAG: hypothetical protein WDZ30_07525 [Cellvibrionaceae bacterium]